MAKFNHFNGRKIVRASTRVGLLVKMRDSEKRGWQLVGNITQYNICGHWVCVMELPLRKEVASQ